MSNESKEDRSRVEGLCGVISRSPRYEWVCVKTPHDPPTQRSLKSEGAGYVPKSERHHFMRRFPNSDH